MNYFDELTNANSRIQELEQQMNDIPSIQFKSIGLSINGDSIPINTIDSSVIINNRTYYSGEFVNNIVATNNNISIQDDIMYIGKIIKAKSYLLNEWEFASSNVKKYGNLTDSYGHMHTNSLAFTGSNCYIVYNLNREYSLLKCSLSIRDNAYLNKTGTLTITAVMSSYILHLNYPN